MRNFLRFIGILELVSYVAGLIIIAITVKFVGAAIFYFIFYIVFGPTIGLLCLYVPRLLDDRDKLQDRVNELEKKVFGEKEKAEPRKDNNSVTVEKSVEVIALQGKYKQKTFDEYATFTKGNVSSTAIINAKTKQKECLLTINNIETEVEGLKVLNEYREYLKTLR